MKVYLYDVSYFFNQFFIFVKKKNKKLTHIFLKKNNYYSIKTTCAKKTTTIVKNATYIFPRNDPRVNDEYEIEAYRKLVLRSAGLPQDTLFDINNLEIIKLCKNTINLYLFYSIKIETVYSRCVSIKIMFSKSILFIMGFILNIMMCAICPQLMFLFCILLFISIIIKNYRMHKRLDKESKER